MSNKIIKLIVVTGLAASAALTAAHAASPVKMGELNCTVNDSDKSLFKTHMVMACDYVDVNGNNAGKYEAKINRTGLKIGRTDTKSMSWIVSTLGDEKNVKIGGTYIGANAGASVGAGGGANYLTGGFNGKISLQPWSVEGKTGLGLELGGQQLELVEVPES